MYWTLFIALAFTIAFHFFPTPPPAAINNRNHQQAHQDAAQQGRPSQTGVQDNDGTAQTHNSKQVKITDSSLRAISISARNLLIEDGDEPGEYTFNTEMLEFLRAIRNKYRVYLLTNMESDYKKENLEKI